jgi:creatinine amidohydrolase
MAARERRYELLYGEELYRLIEERALVWLPLGILEHHGEHLPWGLDGWKAHAVCLRLAARLGGIVLPAMHLAGIHGSDADADDASWRQRLAAIGDLVYRETTFRTWLRETLDALATIGFRVIVAYTGHYPEAQMRAVNEVAAAFSADGPATAIPFWEPLACGEGDHGGKWETSIALALDPDAVRLDAVREDGTGRPGIYRRQEVGRLASAALGEEALARIEAYLAAAIAGMLGDG